MAMKRKSPRVVASYLSLIITLATVMAVILSAPAGALRTGVDKPYPIKSVKVVMGDFESNVALDGVIHFEAQYPGVTALAGRVSEVFVVAGDAVIKDQALFKLDTRDIESLLQKAYAQRESAKAALVSPEDSAQAVLAAVYERENNEWESQILSLKKQIDLSTVRAGRDGYVVEVLTTQGGYLAAGGIGAVLCGIGQEITCAAHQKDVAQITRGMRVRLYAQQSEVGVGTVTGVGALMRDEASGLYSSRITIVPSKKLDLNAGAKIKAEVVTRYQSNVAVVPVEALDSLDRLWQVYEGRAFPVMDAVRDVGGQTAWIQGVSEGTKLIFLPDEKMQAGQRVKETGR